MFGTPTTFFINGRRFPGVRSLGRLEAYVVLALQFDGR